MVAGLCGTYSLLILWLYRCAGVNGSKSMICHQTCKLMTSHLFSIASTSMMIICRVGAVMCALPNICYTDHSFPLSSKLGRLLCSKLSFNALTSSPVLFWSPPNWVSQSIPLQLVCMWWLCQTSLPIWWWPPRSQNDKMLAGMLALNGPKM